jgi:ferritin-like metal-binding protein YciE
MSELKQLFLDELADVHHAENQLLKALPKMARAADSTELRETFESHLEETKFHIQRIKDVFALFDKPARSKRCKAMEGLLAEGNEILKEWKGSPALDAALISAAQKVEHYEIASYGCLRTWAGLLDNPAAKDLLQKTLDEEGAADDKLTGIAESMSNDEAESGGAESQSRMRLPKSKARSSTLSSRRRIGSAMKTMGLVLCLGALTFTSGLTGCAGNRYERSTGEHIDDPSTSSRVKKALGEDPQYKFENVNVATFKGVVQLSGFVNTSEQKSRAGDIAKRTTGAREVENNITVKE